MKDTLRTEKGIQLWLDAAISRNPTKQEEAWDVFEGTHGAHGSVDLRTNCIRVVRYFHELNSKFIVDVEKGTTTRQTLWDYIREKKWHIGSPFLSPTMSPIWSTVTGQDAIYEINRYILLRERDRYNLLCRFVARIDEIAGKQMVILNESGEVVVYMAT